MDSRKITICPSTVDHGVAIRGLLTRAFSPSRYEARLRECVVDAGLDHLEWVALDGETVVGHVLYTPATKGQRMVGFHLAPVAVNPDLQRRGIGTRLIDESLSSAPLRRSSVFVLGAPSYYQRFGFVRTRSARCPFDEGNRHFRALRWDDSGAPFEIGYAPAFEMAERPRGDRRQEG